MLLDNKINELMHLFKQNIHENNTMHMTQNMKGQFPFFGIKIPEVEREDLGFYHYILHRAV